MVPGVNPTVPLSPTGIHRLQFRSVRRGAPPLFQLRVVRRGGCASTRSLLASAFLVLPAHAALLSVPSQVPTLQQAIDQAAQGDVIELSDGTYAAPPGDAATQGFRITDKGVAFTIRAAMGATVVLDGQNAGAVLRFQNSDISKSGYVTFQGLTFRNGSSNVAGLTAGVTLQKALATFSDCVFDSNHTLEPTTGGGGVQVSVGSTATFDHSTWSGNTSAFFGGGLTVEEHSSATVVDSLFSANRVNLPGHQPSASGGAIHVGNSTLVVERTRFEGNAAGYVGGAVYALGLWDDTGGGSYVSIRNSTFVGNQAARDPSVSYPFPTEGGALHAEDLTVLRVWDSRFIENAANNGGGLNAYRSDVEVHESVFQGNLAAGSAALGAKSLGGQISVISNDASDASTGFGTLNPRSVRLLVEESLLQGRFGTTGTAGDVGGCLFAGGDTNRMYGLNGLPQDGTLAQNRADVVLDRVVFEDCDVAQTSVAGSGVGGAISVDLVDLVISDSLVMNSDAVGIPSADNSSGGGLAVLAQSSATVEHTAFAHDTAGEYGGAAFFQGAQVDVEDSAFVSNELSPGVSEPCWPSSTGAALFVAPFDGGGGRPAQPVTGPVAASIFSDNVGLPIFDDDRTNGPENDVQYDGNEFFAPTFAGAVYTSTIPNNVPPYSVCVPASALNVLVVQRANGSSTHKTLDPTTDPNIDEAASIPSASLVAAPSHVPNPGAPADPPPAATTAVGFSWSGGAATLDGAPLASRNGIVFLAPGPHALVVDGGAAQASAVVVPEAAPSFGMAAALASLALLALRVGRRPHRGDRDRQPGGFATIWKTTSPKTSTTSLPVWKRPPVVGSR